MKVFVEVSYCGAELLVHKPMDLLSCPASMRCHSGLYFSLYTAIDEGTSRFFCAKPFTNVNSDPSTVHYL